MVAIITSVAVDDMELVNTEGGKERWGMALTECQTWNSLDNDDVLTGHRSTWVVLRSLGVSSYQSSPGS